MKTSVKTTETKKFSNAFSLTDEICEILRDRILKGEYAIGEKLVENQIAAELKVSRTPVREAFRLLADEGLAEYVPNKGCFARGFTKQDMQDIYQVRKALEQLACEWAIERITDNELDRLNDECDLMEFYVKKKDATKTLAANTSFHEIIYSSTRSRFLSQILRSYQDYVKQARKATVDIQSLEQIYLEHKNILKAIREKDVDMAKEMVGVHMDNSRKRAEAKWGIR